MSTPYSAPVTTTRFAPSPSGPLHLGHAVSAMAAHDAARATGGRFLLRIDDIDAGRSRAEYVDAAMADLDWLGLTWDGPPVFQSARTDHYAAALDRLRGIGLAYPCFCTRADIAAAATAPQGAAGAVYPGTCRHLTDGERTVRMASEPHAWRIAMDAAVARAGPLTWIDVGAGEQVADPTPFGDIVLARKDAPSSYHLASTLDDADLGVTLVVRGRDLFTATHIHRLLQGLLDLPVPRWRHHDLIGDAAGRRLAKRDGAAALSALRDAGADGPALAEKLRAGQLPAGYSWVTA